MKKMRVPKFVYQIAKNYYAYILGIFISTCLIAVSETVKPYLIKQLVDIAARQLPSRDLWIIALYFGILRVTLVISWIVNDRCVSRCRGSLQLDVAEFFMRRLYDHPYKLFQDISPGSITSKLNDAFQHLPTLVFTIINSFCYFMLIMVISLILMFSVSPIFAIILCGWVILFLTVTFFSMRKSISLNKAYSEEKSRIMGACSDYLTNMLTVKIFVTKEYEIDRFSLLKRNFIDIAKLADIYHSRVDVLLGILNSIYSIGLIIFLIIGYNKKLISPGDFAFVVIANFNIISVVYRLSQIFKEFIINWSAVDQALLTLEEPSEIPSGIEQKELLINTGKITFDSVKFHYEGAKPLFQRKSIVIEAGQKVGLVGYSGSGKSTFVNLILKLYNVTGGKILIDDQNIFYVRPDSLRRNISLIPQDPSLFNRNLIENIRYGKTSATDEEVIEAAKKANAHEFISALPKGYRSLVGDKGIKLSGGQRQRIAIARAILKNAPILILDEATSQLDTIAERLIQESLLELMRGKTTIVIAHRLSTVVHMDRILVFNKGAIVEDDSHLNLLSQKGLYKTLWDVQVNGLLPVEA